MVGGVATPVEAAGSIPAPSEAPGVTRACEALAPARLGCKEKDDA